MLLNPFNFYKPTTLSEAAQLCSTLDNVKLLAGGTFLLNNLKSLKRKGLKTPKHVISLKHIKELKGISEEKNQIVIKAMATISDLIGSPLLKGNLGFLKTAARNIGTTPIRNMATVGGNLTCRYTWTELPAIMVGLDADLCFLGSGGQYENLPAEDFFKTAAKTNNIFVHAMIKKDPKASIIYRRVKKSPNLDIPLLSLLIKTNIKNNQFTNTRVSINNGVAFAQRDFKLEQFLNQSERSEKIVNEALEHVDEVLYDTRSSAYKKHMFRYSIQSAISELIHLK